MLAYFRDVEATGEELIVMDNKTPVLRVSRIQTGKPWAEIFPKRGKLKHIPEKSLLEPETESWGDYKL